MRHVHALTLLLLVVVTGCASGAAVTQEPPRIVDRPISFSAQRQAMTQAYMRDHYGLEPRDISIVPRMIVLHWTAIETFEESFRTFDAEYLSGRPDIAGGGDVNVSIQFLVDRDGTVYRLMPETWMARHVIGLNHVAIGVENVGTGSPTSDTLTDAQIEANARLVRYLAEKYPSIEYLIGHHEYQTFDGHPLWRELDEGYRTEKIDPGDRFMNAVRSRVADLELEGAPTAVLPLR